MVVGADRFQLMDFQSVSFDLLRRLEVIVAVSPAPAPCGVLTSAWVRHDSEMTDGRLIFKLSVVLLTRRLLRESPEKLQLHWERGRFGLQNSNAALKLETGDETAQVRKQKRERRTSVSE